MVQIGLESPKRSKICNFQNWLDTRPKMETHEANVYSTILGGFSQGFYEQVFWSPFLDLGARSTIFRHLKKGTVDKLLHTFYLCVPFLDLRYQLV